MTKHDKKWNKQYEQLVEFKRKNGHCVVPQRNKDDASLGKWVNKQRSNQMNDTLGLDRKERLDEIGFFWKDDGGHNYEIWHKQYEKLVEYKLINGHCKVPQTRNKDEKSLGVWAMHQRARHARKEMPPDRKALLDALEFVWRKNDSLAIRKSGGIRARTNQRCKAKTSSSSVEEDGCGRDEEEDSKPSLVTSSAAPILGSSPGQEAVQEQVTTLGEIPYGWTRVKLEPDC
jgi:hypothetical protein